MWNVGWKVVVWFGIVAALALSARQLMFQGSSLAAKAVWISALVLSVWVAAYLAATVRPMPVRILGALHLVASAGGVAMLLWAAGSADLWGMIWYDQRREGDYRIGDKAPDVSLLELDGVTPASLRGHLGTRPLVLIFGSFT